MIKKEFKRIAIETTNEINDYYRKPKNWRRLYEKISNEDERENFINFHIDSTIFRRSVENKSPVQKCMGTIIKIDNIKEGLKALSNRSKNKQK